MFTYVYSSMNICCNSTKSLKNKLSNVDRPLTSSGMVQHTQPLHTNPAGSVTAFLMGEELHTGGSLGQERWESHSSLRDLEASASCR